MVVGYGASRSAVFGCRSSGRLFTAALSNATAFSVDWSVPRYQWRCSKLLPVRRPRATPVCSNLVYSLRQNSQIAEAPRKALPSSKPSRHPSRSPLRTGPRSSTQTAKIGFYTQRQIDFFATAGGVTRLRGCVWIGSIRCGSGCVEIRAPQSPLQPTQAESTKYN